jgi:hypothetical protein
MELSSPSVSLRPKVMRMLATVQRRGRGHRYAGRRDLEMDRDEADRDPG